MIEAATGSGTLYIVATPIGNLDDMSARAVAILRSADVIAAEDTRVSAVLMRHHGIDTPMIALHEHNEERRAPSLVERLLGGDSVALVSDAGTPLVNDPGYRLVRLARNAGVAVSPIPGPCALVAALACCGLPAAKFTFEGFLPSSRAARRAALAALAAERRTMVFYEAPHRVREAVADMARTFGEERPAAIARELSKRFETVVDATLGVLAAWLDAGEYNRRGEFVIVVQGLRGAEGEVLRPEWVEAVRELGRVMPPKQAARIIAGATGARSQALYRAARGEGSE